MVIKTFVIIATGPSLTQSDVDLIKKAKDDGIIQGVIAVSNSALLAPWADALVSHDAKWWNVHKKWTSELKMRKFSRQAVPGIETFVPKEITQGCNSGLMAAFVARDIFKADRLLYVGLDMKGTHFFGLHPEPLRNPTEIRFSTHVRQFNTFSGCSVINCTEGSVLKKFPIMKLSEALQ